MVRGAKQDKRFNELETNSPGRSCRQRRYLHMGCSSIGRQPYTHQISLSFPVINTLLKQTGSKPLLPAQGKGSRRGIFGRAC
ncbi:hypothetical protein P692DRAFT_20825869, partial [Suillus brevipes Sb2]